MSSQDALNRLLKKGVHPHTDALAQIAVDGDVAVVVFEPAAPAKEAARKLGWDGKSPVFRLPSSKHAELGKADHVTAAWLQRRDEGVSRMFVIMHEGTLLVNFAPERGYWVESGSTDPHVLS